MSVGGMSQSDAECVVRAAVAGIPMHVAQHLGRAPTVGEMLEVLAAVLASYCATAANGDRALTVGLVQGVCAHLTDSVGPAMDRSLAEAAMAAASTVAGEGRA